MPAINRVRDALLGGREAFRADRELAEQVRAVAPESEGLIRRAYQWHACAAGQAVTRWGKTGAVFAGGGFLPPGEGLPHTQAAALNPAARFLYATDDYVAGAVLRRRLAEERDDRALVTQVSPRDPAAVMGEAGAAGCGERVSVHLMLAAHFWAPDAAAEVIAGYGQQMEQGGGALLLSLRSFAETPEGETLMALARAAGVPVYRHAAGDVEDWLKAAGMDVAVAGDIRLLGGGEWADGQVPFPAAGPVIGMVAVRIPARPAAADGPPPDRRRPA